MAGSPASMLNFARAAKVAALLLFFLPWVTVSCAEQPFITMTGVNLVTGSLSMTNPMTGVAESPPGMGSGGDPFVMIGAALIVIGLIVSFLVKGKGGAMGAALCALLAGVALAYTVLLRVPQAVTQGTAGAGATGADPAAAAAGPGGMTPEQVAEMIRVNIEIGFWLVLAALAAAVVLNILAMKDLGRPAALAADPPPPTI
jgi:hypothetical protein